VLKMKDLHLAMGGAFGTEVAIIKAENFYAY
jgi:hypothetical protein